MLPFIHAAQEKEQRKKRIKKKGTTAKQDKDDVSEEQISGAAPLDWIQFQVKGKTGFQWVSEEEVSPQRIADYLNSGLFGVRQFPLPGDIQVLTGGPPCQGFSGYNTQRIVTQDMTKLMKHRENRLLVRFLEVCWFYRPLYVCMEEVPAVARKDVMLWMEMVYRRKGYSMVYEKSLLTGRYGCNQTRPRLIILATLNGMPAMAIPEPQHALHEVSGRVGHRGQGPGRVGGPTGTMGTSQSPLGMAY